MTRQRILPCTVWFKSIDCAIVRLHISANTGVHWWLLSRPLVILLGLPGLWPDMCFKSYQKLWAEDAGMCHLERPLQGPSALSLTDIDTDSPALMLPIWLFRISNTVNYLLWKWLESECRSPCQASLNPESLETQWCILCELFARPEATNGDRVGCSK